MVCRLIARAVIGLAISGLGALGGCGTPLLHPAATDATALRDDGLAGEWASEDGTEIRAVISPAQAAPAYEVALTVRDQKQVKTSLSLELTLTEIGGNRYMDLFLAGDERDRLVEKYGFLVVPVHQVLRTSREGDTLRVWPFRGDWLEERPESAEFAHDRVTIGGGEAAIVTARTDQVRTLLSRHGGDAAAFGDPITFHRVRK